MKVNNGGIIGKIALLSRREDEGLGGGAGGSEGGSGRSDEVDDWDQRQQDLFAQHSNIVASVNADMTDTVNEMTAQLQRTELGRFDEATAYLSALQADASSTEEIKLKEIAKMREHVLNLRNKIENSPVGADTDELDEYYQTLVRITKEVEESMMKELTLFREGITKQEGEEKAAIRNNLIKQHNYTTLLMDMLLETTGPNELSDTSGNYLANIDEDVYLKYDEAIKSLKTEYEESIDLLFADLIDDTEEINRRTKKLKTSQNKVSGAMDNVVEKKRGEYISSAEYYVMWQFIVRNGITIPYPLENKNREASEKIIKICEMAMGHTPSTNIKKITDHKIVKQLRRHFKPGEDGGGGEYVSPYSNDQIKYNDMSVAEAKKMMEVASGYVSAVGVDKVYIVRKQASRDMWWYKLLPERAKVLVSAIDSWKRTISTSSKSEGDKIRARHAIEELGMCEESNKDVYDRFRDETNSDVSIM